MDNNPIMRKTKKQKMRERIRAAYAEQVHVQVIPAKSMDPTETGKKLRVCAYCRVSTEMDTQVTSYELQVQNYKEYISSKDEWELVEIYADEGISATSMKHRESFLRMIEDCQAGKIDLIITKSINRFARNILDAISTIRMLKQLNPPVGVYFETEHLNTLDITSESHIALLSIVAQGESEAKSRSLKWSYVRRWKHGVGIYPSWNLLGYYTDEDGKWVIHHEQAEIVSLIYELYLTGFSSTQIAEFLSKSGVPTVYNRNDWHPVTVLSILKNEKYCGDVLCQKTISIDLFSHKIIKNDGRSPQYYIEDHHEPIIDRSDWQQVQRMVRDKYYLKHRKRRRKPHIVAKGCLTGFTMIDMSWTEEDIQALFCKEPTLDVEQEAYTHDNKNIIKVKGEK